MATHSTRPTGDIQYGDPILARAENVRRKRAEAEANGEEYVEDVPETVEESVEKYGPRANGL